MGHTLTPSSNAPFWKRIVYLLLTQVPSGNISIGFGQVIGFETCFRKLFFHVSSCSIFFPSSGLPFSEVLSLVQIRSIKGHGVQKVQPIVLQEAECSFMACHDDGMRVLMGAGDNVIEVRGVICLQCRGGGLPWVCWLLTPWQKSRVGLTTKTWGSESHGFSPI